jgi:hypothetical protein
MQQPHVGVGSVGSAADSTVLLLAWWGEIACKDLCCVIVLMRCNQSAAKQALRHQ